MELSRAEREHIEGLGVYNVRVVRIYRDKYGDPNLLLEGENTDELLRGWLYYGAGPIDIEWHPERVDGWPEDLT